MDLYILNNRVAKRVDIGTWNEWKEDPKNKADCIVARNYVCGFGVVTEFRGYDPDGAGYLFVTKITGAGSEKWKSEAPKARNWEEAEDFHERICGRIVRDYQTKLTKEAHQTHRE